jgi:hypothetical protein
MEDKMVEKKAVTIYLEPWQKRMFKDYAKSANLKAITSLRNIVSITIDFTKPVHMNSYRVPQKPGGLEEDGFEIYFTDTQMASLKEAIGLEAVSSMHVTAAQFKSEIFMIR